MKHLEHTLAPYLYSYCDMCNILIYFCNIQMKHYNIQMKHLKHLKRTLATCAFSAISPCNMSFLLAGGALLRLNQNILLFFLTDFGISENPYHHRLVTRTGGDIFSSPPVS